MIKIIIASIKEKKIIALHKPNFLLIPCKKAAITTPAKISVAEEMPIKELFPVF